MTIEEKSLLEGYMCCITVATPYKEKVFLVEGVDPEKEAETVIEYMKEGDEWATDFYVARKLGPYGPADIRWVLDRNDCTILDKDGFWYEC